MRARGTAQHSLHYGAGLVDFDNLNLVFCTEEFMPKHKLLRFICCRKHSSNYCLVSIITAALHEDKACSSHCSGYCSKHVHCSKHCSNYCSEHCSRNHCSKHCSKHCSNHCSKLQQTLLPKTEARLNYFLCGQLFPKMKS